MDFTIDRIRSQNILGKKESGLESILVSHNCRSGNIHGSQWHLVQMPPEWSLTSAFHCMLALQFYVAEPGLPSGCEPHSTHFTQRWWLFSQFQFNNENKQTKYLKWAFWLVQSVRCPSELISDGQGVEWSPVRKWRSNTWSVGEKQFLEEGREMMGRHPQKIHSDSFYRCGNLGSEKLSDLLKVTACT